MIKIYMRVAHRMRKRPRHEITHMRQHMRQQCITGNIKRHAQAHITTTLVQLTMQMPLLLLPLLTLFRARITDIELRKHVAWWQRHDLQIRGVPRTQNNAAIVRRVTQLANHLRQLIHALPCVVRLGMYVLSAEVPPLEAIDRAEVTLRTLREPNAVEVGARAVAVPDLDTGF